MIFCRVTKIPEQFKESVYNSKHSKPRYDQISKAAYLIILDMYIPNGIPYMISHNSLSRTYNLYMYHPRINS